MQNKQIRIISKEQQVVEFDYRFRDLSIIVAENNPDEDIKTDM
jgi:hypothetical protein